MEIGPNGIEKVFPLDESKLTAFERELVGKAVPDLKKEIAKGVKKKLPRASLEITNTSHHFIP